MKTIAYDENSEKSIENWNRADVYFSSLLLDIETAINIYKYCIKYKKDKKLYIQKTTESKQLLESIDRKIIDQDVLSEIQNVDKLKVLKSLDGIDYILSKKIMDMSCVIFHAEG
ncbi:MAG: hypothetical protein JRI22_22210 [Deltaproteobacteria bacterium]|nr:hypothetical protein [Deltaproteobacteria bacterium]